MKVQSNLIAYQTVDSDGDIWCNQAFLFETQGLANVFFKDVRKIIDSLKHIEIDELGEEVLENLDTRLTTYESKGDVSMAVLDLDDDGIYTIKRMGQGVLILQK